MANSLTGLIPVIYSALNVVSREMVGRVPAVSRDASAAQAAVDEPIRSPVVAPMTADDITPNNVTDTGSDRDVAYVDLKITKQKKVDFHLTGEQSLGLKGNNAPIAQQSFEQAFRTLTNMIEADLAGLYASSSRVRAASYVAPTMIFDAGDLREAFSIQTRQPSTKLYNAVRGTFVSPDDLYNPVSYPALKSTAYAAEDGEERWADYDLPFTDSSSMAQRLIKLELNRSRQHIGGTLKLDLSALDVAVGDIIGFDYDRFGWTAKEFEVQAVSPVMSDVGMIGFDVTIVETSAAVYDWLASEEQPYLAGPKTDLKKNISAPGNLGLTPEVVQVEDGTTNSFVLAKWDEADSASIDFYEVRWRLGSETIWERANVAGTSHRIGPVPPNYIVEVTVRARTTGGRYSPYTPVAATTAIGDTSPPAAPTVLSAEAGYRSVSLSWTNPADTDFSGVVVYRSTTNSFAGSTEIARIDASSYDDTGLSFGSTYYYWIEAFDYTGNGIADPAARTGPVSATTIGVQASETASGTNANASLASEVAAATSAGDASSSSSAASSSANAALASENAAGSSASSASTSANTATTQAGSASVSAASAASSAASASSDAASALSSETVVAELANVATQKNADPYLVRGLAGWGTAQNVQFPPAYIETADRFTTTSTDPVAGGPMIECRGYEPLYSVVSYPVEDGRQYRLRVRIEQSANTDNVRTYLGYRAYDGDFNNIGGTRYVLALGVTLATGVWTEFTRDLNPAFGGGSLQIPVGAKYIRFVALMNYANHSVTNVSRLSMFSIEDITEIEEVTTAAVAVESAARVSAEGAAEANYTIRTQAVTGGVRAMAGIDLFSYANPDGTTTNDIAMLADRLVLYASSSATAQPMFSITSNVAYFNMDLVANGSITANHMAAESVTANKLAANSVTAAKMNINDLAAISANLGTVTVTGNLSSSNYSEANETGHQIRPDGTATFYGAVLSRQLEIDSGTVTRPNEWFVNAVDDLWKNSTKAGDDIYVETNIPVAQWEGAKEAYVVEAGFESGMSIFKRNGASDADVKYGVRAHLLPLQTLSGTPKIWLRLQGWAKNVTRIRGPGGNANSDIEFNWRVYRVT